MLRPAILASFVLASTAPAAEAQNYAGTWSATTQTGTALTLQLQQDARGQVTGNLSGNGTVFQVQAQFQQGQIVGIARNQQGAVHLQAQLANAVLNVVLSELGPNNQPVPGQSQQIQMTRTGGDVAQSSPPSQLGQVMGQQPGRGAGRGAAADPFVGTFQGQDLVITLQRSGAGYSGTAQSAGGQYPVQAQVANGVMSGSYTDRGMQRTFQAAVQGDVMQLQADGTQFMLQRAGQMAGAGQGRGQGQGQGQMGGGQGGGAGAGSLASTPQDQQIAQFLMANRWCSFAYSQTSGRTSTEQVQFLSDGTATRGQQSETQSSNPNGQYYGNSQGGDRGRWRIQNGQLMLSADGVQWAPTPLQITRNSNGYPIVTAGGKEYSQCN